MPPCAGERRQVRRQVVAAALAELVEEVGGPVRLVDFEAVAEDREGRCPCEGACIRRSPTALRCCRARGAVVVIEHQALGAHGGALHRLPRVAGDEVVHVAGRFGDDPVRGSRAGRSRATQRFSPSAAAVGRSAFDGRGSRPGRLREAECAGRRTASRCRASGRMRRPSSWAFSEVKRSVVEELVGEVRQVAESGARIVERQG